MIAGALLRSPEDREFAERTMQPAPGAVQEDLRTFPHEASIRSGARVVVQVLAELRAHNRMEDQCEGPRV
jgi:hypothetical protein